MQRIKSEGDYAAAKTLFETHGIHFDPTLRDEIVKRVEALNLPSYTGFVMPKLTAVTDAARRDHRRHGLVSDGPDEADAGVRRSATKHGPQPMSRSGRSVGLFAPGPGSGGSSPPRARARAIVDRRVAIDHLRLILKETAGVRRRTVGRIERLPPQSQIHSELTAMMGGVRQPAREHPRARAPTSKNCVSLLEPRVGLRFDLCETLGRDRRVVLEERLSVFPRTAAPAARR